MTDSPRASLRPRPAEDPVGLSVAGAREGDLAAGEAELHEDLLVDPRPSFVLVDDVDPPQRHQIDLTDPAGEVPVGCAVAEGAGVDGHAVLQGGVASQPSGWHRGERLTGARHEMQAPFAGAAAAGEAAGWSAEDFADKVVGCQPCGDCLHCENAVAKVKVMLVLVAIVLSRIVFNGQRSNRRSSSAWMSVSRGNMVLLVLISMGHILPIVGAQNGKLNLNIPVYRLNQAYKHTVLV